MDDGTHCSNRRLHHRSAQKLYPWRWNLINRAAVLVGPRQPYIDWALGLDESGLAPEHDSEKTVYLIPEYNDDIEALEILSQFYTFIFEEELGGWHTDETAWPKNRTFKIFREWFDVQFHSIVDDLCDYELIDED